MMELGIAFLVYATVGIAFCVYLAKRDKVSHGAILAFVSNDLVGLVFLAVLWPFFAFVMLVEQSFVSEDQSTPESGSNHMVIPIGTRGITTTRMNPSGKFQFEGNTFPAASVSGFIDQGEPVEVVGMELAEYKIKKVEQGEDANAGHAPG